MTKDPEIIAMSQVLELFKYLDNGQRRRIIDWVSSRFNVEAEVMIPVLNDDQEPETRTLTTVPVQPADITDEAPVQPVESIVQTESSETPIVQAEAQSEEEDEVTVPPVETAEDDDSDPLKNLGLKRYGSIETLFLSSSVNTVSSKILLCAAYLQEKMDFEELSSYDINSRLKKLGYGVANISNSLNTLISKEPPLMTQTRKIGDSKQAKRRFKVTEEGLRIARTYLRGKAK